MRLFLRLFGRLVFESLGLLDSEVFFDVLQKGFVPAAGVKLVNELLQFTPAVQRLVVILGQCLLSFGPVVDVLFASVYGHLELLKFQLLFKVSVGHLGQGVFFFLQLRNQLVQFDLAVIQFALCTLDEGVVDTVDVCHLERE